VREHVESLALRSRRCRQLRLNIHPAAEYRRILDVLNCLELPTSLGNPENVKFAVLELISNSLRAHRERRVEQQVLTMLRYEDGYLTVTIRDFGGGFDPYSLPYDLEGDVRAVDPNGSRFLEYQKRNNFQRFGMGLLVARRVFPDFSLVFLDAEGRPVRWGEGQVSGTFIQMSTQGERT
jgi:anti-sigma regulatory factor (Ser/Thr protein kinase)